MAEPVETPVTTEATVKVHIGGKRVIATAEGNVSNAARLEVRGLAYPVLAAADGD